ncbi:DUF192 domain-containing protein [Pseudomonas sp. xss_1]|uniref:DUF192 domain-containing protein n=1 Tax=Pseudomonas sp. xss_1 TaxID=3367214 RepID=UPI00370ABF47
MRRSSKACGQLKIMVPLTIVFHVSTLLASTSAPSPQPPTADTCKIQFETGGELTLPVARTADAMKQGLMGKYDPGPGVIFVWPEPGVRGVWMKNTPAPLSAGWISAKGELQAILELEPQSMEKRSSFEPAIAIIEVPRGTFETVGIRVGDQVVKADCLNFR